MQTPTMEPIKAPNPSKPVTAQSATLVSVPVPSGNGAQNSAELLEKARTDSDAVLKELGSQLGGLTQ